MHAAAGTFKQRASIALKDVTLQASLGKLTREGLVVRRAKAVAEFPEFQALREEGRRIKDHVLAHLDFYLERYEAEVTKAGGKVQTPVAVADACADCAGRQPPGPLARTT